MISEILGIQKSSVQSVAQLNEKLSSTSARKKLCSGVARELFQLCGASLSSIPISEGSDSKSKQSCAKWVWCSFKNEAHPSKIHLHRWQLLSETRNCAADQNQAGEPSPAQREASVPGSVGLSQQQSSESYIRRDEDPQNRVSESGSGSQVPPACCSFQSIVPYPAAAFNKKTQITRYTASTYEELLSKLDRGWSKWETDYLFDLCEEFDLRFPVLYDRYSPAEEVEAALGGERRAGASAVLPSVKALRELSSEQLGQLAAEVRKEAPRPLEQLKERYYSVARTLLESEHRKKVANIEQRFDSLTSTVAPENVDLLRLQKAELLEEARNNFARHPLIKHRYDPVSDKQRRKYLRLQLVDKNLREENQILYHVAKMELVNKKASRKAGTPSIGEKRSSGSPLHGAADETDVQLAELSKSSEIAFFPRAPGPNLASQLMRNFFQSFLCKSFNITLPGSTPPVGNASKTQQSNAAFKRLEAKVEAELKTLGFGTSNLPMWPTHSDMEMAEAVNGLRMDVIIALIWKQRVEQLEKETASWKAKSLHSKDAARDATRDATRDALKLDHELLNCESSGKRAKKRPTAGGVCPEKLTKKIRKTGVKKNASAD